MVYQNTGKLDNHKHSNSGDFTTLTYHVTFITCYHPSIFGGHRLCRTGDIKLLICPKILWNHMIQRSCDFKNIISGIQFNHEQYHQKLKHSCNFDKNQRSKTKFLSIKLFGLLWKWLLACASQMYCFIDKNL